MRSDHGLKGVVSLTRFAPSLLVDGLVASDLSIFIQFDLLTCTYCEVTQLDIRGHGARVRKIGLAEFTGFFSAASHEELFMVTGRTLEQFLGASKLAASGFRNHTWAIPVVTLDEHLALGADDEISGTR